MPALPDDLDDPPPARPARPARPAPPGNPLIPRARLRAWAPDPADVAAALHPPPGGQDEPRDPPGRG